MTKKQIIGLVVIVLVGVGAAALLYSNKMTPMTDTPTEEVVMDTENLAAGGTMPAIGTCITTKITLVGTRLEGVADSGSYVGYENELSQVTYDVVPAMLESQVGDEVELCVVSLPENCPPNDMRGIVYSATNKTMGTSWEAPDSQHMCGGA